MEEPPKKKQEPIPGQTIEPTNEQGQQPIKRTYSPIFNRLPLDQVDLVVKAIARYRRQLKAKEEEKVFKPIDSETYKRLNHESNGLLWKEYDEKYHELGRNISALLREYNETIKWRRHYRSLFRTGKLPSKINLSFDNKIENRMFGNMLMSIWSIFWLLLLGGVIIIALIGGILKFFGIAL
jgi:hypothetical protein